MDTLKNQRNQIEGELNKYEEQCKVKNREKNDLLKCVNKLATLRTRNERLIANIAENKRSKISEILFYR